MRNITPLLTILPFLWFHGACLRRASNSGMEKSPVDEAKAGRPTGWRQSVWKCTELEQKCNKGRSHSAAATCYPARVSGFQVFYLSLFLRVYLLSSSRILNDWQAVHFLFCDISLVGLNSANQMPPTSCFCFKQWFKFTLVSMRTNLNDKVGHSTCPWFPWGPCWFQTSAFASSLNPFRQCVAQFICLPK